MITTVLISIAASAITSFLVGRIYINVQYHSSNSGYRQAMVIAATHEIINSFHADTEKLPEELANKYLYSLGPLIFRMLHSFGTHEHLFPRDALPALIDAEGADSWSFYEKVIRPVKEDMNNNSFIGWFLFVHNVRLMTTLWNICHIAENIIMEMAAIEGISKAKNVPLPYSVKDTGIIFGSSDKMPAAYKLHLLIMKENYKSLKINWHRWLYLNKAGTRTVKMDGIPE